MGDTMREAFEAWCKGDFGPLTPNVQSTILRKAFYAGHEAGRQLGMEQSRREPERHEVDILLQQLNDAAMAVDSDQFGLPGDDVPWGELRHIVVSWFANNTAPTQQAGDSDTQS